MKRTLDQRGHARKARVCEALLDVAIWQTDGGDLTRMRSPDCSLARQRLRRAFPLVGLWLLVFAWSVRPIWDMDIFFHIAIGRAVAANGIPDVDVFSAATPDAPWTPFQLGYEGLVYGLDWIGGLDLVRGFHAALLASAIVVMALRFRRMTCARLPAAALTVLALVLFEERIRCRPHMFNLLFESWVLLPLAAGWWTKHPRRFIWIAAATGLVWAFIHAMGALWLLAVLGCFVILGQGTRDRATAALALAASVVAIALAPGAAGGILHVMSIQEKWAAFVPELAPSWSFFADGTTFAALQGTLPWLAVVAVALAARRVERARWPTLLVAAGLALAAIFMARLIYYAAFAIALVWADLPRPRLGEHRLRMAGLIATSALAGALAFHVLPRWRHLNPWTTTVQPGLYPETEATLIREAGISARIYNEAEWGGYLLYRLHPPSTVISDGRITFSDEVAGMLIADRHRSHRVAVADRAFERFGVDMLIRRPGNFPGGPSWRLLMRGPVAELWTRSGPVARARLEALQRAQARQNAQP